MSSASPPEIIKKYDKVIINEGELYDMLSSLPNYLELQDTRDIRGIFISLLEHYGTGIPEDDIILQSIILKLIYTLKKLAHSLDEIYKPKNNNRKIIEKTISYISHNLTADLSLATLSSKFSSQSYFNYAFKRSIGMTPREYAKKIMSEYEKNQ